MTAHATAAAGRITAAVHADAPVLEDIVDRAYRQRIPGAWTTEHGRVTGRRITAAGISDLIDDSAVELLVARDYTGPGSHDGCILLQWPHGGDAPELGLFAVEPTTQGRGVGRALVNALERHAAARGYSAVRLMVLEDRPEITAWYERLGYSLTGTTGAFPEGTPSAPVNPHVRFVEMRKPLSSPERGPEPGAEHRLPR